MQHFAFNLSDDLSTPFDHQASRVDDPRPYPTEAQLRQFGTAVMNEAVDLIGDTALEDLAPMFLEALIGAFHSTSQRLLTSADKSREELSRLDRDFDGSEVANEQIEEATKKTMGFDIAMMAAEIIRDAAAETYTTQTGEVWTAWRGNVRSSRVTAAQLTAREMIRANDAAKHAMVTPGRPVVAFRGAPVAKSPTDASRIYDALNWALSQWPDMALATSGAPGAERLAIKWAKAKGVQLITAAADFDRHAKAAPFKANEDLIRLKPVICLTLPNSLEDREEREFGPALNLGQQADRASILHKRIRAKAA